MPIMKKGFYWFGGCMNVHIFNEVDFIETERRLGIELPKEIA